MYKECRVLRAEYAITVTVLSKSGVYLEYTVAEIIYSAASIKKSEE